MKKKHLRYTIQSEINIVPFLDILLILLIIFMMMPFQFMQGFHVDLPSSSKSVDVIKNYKSIITIEILDTGLYNFILNMKKNINNINMEKLSAEIQNAIHINSNSVCLIAASKTIKYNEIIKILNLLNSIGVESVGMITKPIY
ncbi:tolR protein [Candidatus Blochmanniella floridana]|uniref:TolR protein n=1 Tax=Blochmanniella floridana TaxID=203907 RepID=Q7VR86_BLOFL|nr:tolR protein [Candidatus Blochmannia floridanus]